jgi:hypothetical protein
MRRSQEEYCTDSLRKKAILLKLPSEDVGPLCDKPAQAMAYKDNRILLASSAYLLPRLIAMSAGHKEKW